MGSVLLVDTPTHRELARILLGYMGHEVFEASSGPEALALARKTRPSLVIADVLMPGVDVCDLVRQLSADAKLRGTPVIFQAAVSGASQAKELAASCGVRTVLPKPCEPEQFLAAIAEVLGTGERSEHGELAKRSSAPQHLEDTFVGYLSQLRSVKAELDDVIQSARLQPRGGSDVSAWYADNVTKVKRLASRLSAAFEVGIAMTSERDPKKLLRLFLAAICDVVEAKAAAVGLLDEQEARLQYAVTRNLDARTLRDPERGGKHLALLRTLVKQRKSIRGPYAAVMHDAGRLPGPPAATETILGLPIATRNRLYGSIYFAGRNDGQEFSGEDERLAAIMVAQFALLYEHALLYELIQRHVAALHLETGERRRIQEALRESEAGLRRAQLMAKLAHVVTDCRGAFESWSTTLPTLAGVMVDELPRTMNAWLQLVHAPDRKAVCSAWDSAVRSGRRTELEYRLKRPNGAPIHVRHTLEPLAKNSDGPKGMRWFSTLQDVTESRIAQQRIARLNRVYAVLSSIKSAIVRIRDKQELLDEVCRVATEAGRFVMAWVGLVEDSDRRPRLVAAAGSIINPPPAGASVAARYGDSDADDLAVQAVRSQTAVVVNDVENDPRLGSREALSARGVRSLAILPLAINDESVGVLGLHAADAGFFNDEEMRLLGELAGDVSYALDYIEKARQLDYLSYYDPVTGFANRTLFLQLLQQRIIDARSVRRRFAVWLIDIERFRTLNDALGRQAGDLLLRRVAGRIDAVECDTSRVARIAGDQFACIAPDAQHEDEIARLTELRHQQVFGSPFEVGEQTLWLAARIGIALFPDDGADADTLLRNAEAALKQAKGGSGRYVFHTSEMTARVAENLSLENRLRQALDKDEYVLHYQPKVDVETREIVGLEALIRWESPQLGLVPPRQFIPLLEETTLILEVGEWALKRAALDHRSWQAAGLEPPIVAINVSGVQLRQRDFVKTVERSIEEAIRGSVELEITETIMMEDVGATIQKLHDLRRLGIGIAIDDFGTGYSSLFYLARLPVETIKIDGSFVATMAGEPTTMAVVQTMISLAHSLGIKVVAEGVETEEQAKMLRLHACDQMQGFLISSPLTKEEIAALLRNRRG